MRIACYDIEATGLKADFAFLLCCAFGDVDSKKVKLLSLSDFVKGDENPLVHEEKLVKAVAKEFASVDVLVSYYGKGFDRPFLNAKMIEYGLPPLPPLPEVDLYFTTKHGLAISRKSLANLAYYARVPNKKTVVDGRLWKAAQAGNRKALREIEKHNIADVEVLRDVYEVMRPLVRQHPWIGRKDGCRFCGSKRIQSRGVQISKLKGEQRRIQCRACSAWDTRSLKDMLDPRA